MNYFVYITLLVTCYFCASTFATGACNDNTDLSIFQKDSTTFHQIVKGCAESCWGRGTCTANCLTKQTGLTDECALCWGNDTSCTAKNCFTSCMNPDSQNCIDCSKKYCLPTLLECACNNEQNCNQEIPN